MPTLQPIHHERSWLAFLLLVGSGAASAAPLPAASLHVNTTNAPWLWPVQAARGQTNAASISLEILPSQTVSVGGKVSFGVTARKRGYLILVDVDAEGRMSQIFPTSSCWRRRTGATSISSGLGSNSLFRRRRRGSADLNMSLRRRPGLR